MCKEFFESRVLSTFLSKKYVVFILGCFPCVANAHVKWFVTTEGIHQDSRFQLDWLSLLLIVGFLSFLGACFLLKVKASTSPHLFALLHKPLASPLFDNNVVWSSLKFSIAILLIANIIQGHFIAPNFAPESPTQSQMLLQAGLVIMLIVNVTMFAWLLASFSLLILFIYPLASAVDYALELFAIGISLYYLHNSRSHRFFATTLGPYRIGGLGKNIGLGVLRLGLGLQLMILTIHDKFMHPGLALNFLEHHPQFNFVQVAGWTDFSHLHFVLAAGLAELAFGILLVTNFGSRIALLMILFFFTLSGVVLGPEELIGHIPIVVAALVLFASPSSEFLRFSRTTYPRLLID